MVTADRGLRDRVQAEGAYGHRAEVVAAATALIIVRLHGFPQDRVIAP